VSTTLKTTPAVKAGVADHVWNVDEMVELLSSVGPKSTRPALAAGKRLCGPFAWRDRPDFTCFQNASETAAIARGVAIELGPLKDPQGKPEVGPFAKSK
jgi:hypothetical protein